MRGTYLLRSGELALLAAAAAATGAMVAMASYAIHPAVPLAVLGAALAVALSVTKPMASVCVAVALIPLELFSVRLGAFGLSAAEAMFLITAAGWTVRRATRAESPFFGSPLAAPLGLLVAAILPGLVVSPDAVGVSKTLLMWGAFLLVFHAIVAEGTSRSVERLLLVFAASAAAVAAIALVTSSGQQQTLVGFGDIAEGRAVGSFGHPNDLAAYEVLAIPVALALALGGPVALRPLAGVAGALCFAGLTLSLSRGGLLAAVGAAGVLLLWAPFRRFVAVAAVVAALLLVSGLGSVGDFREVSVVSKRLSSIRYSAQGVDPRLVIWQKTPAIIGDHPFVGVGANSYADVAPRYGLISTRLGGAYDHAHNIPLTITTELGFVGLAALGWLVVALGRTLIEACRSRTTTTRAVGFALAAAFVGFGVQGMVDHTLRANVIAASIFLLCGCAVVVARSRESDSEARRSPLAGEGTR